MGMTLKYWEVQSKLCDMEKKIIINIGRQFGCGGKRIASALSERLGIPVYDNELLIKAAERSGVSEEFFLRCDEKKSFFQLSFSQNAINDEGLFEIQSKVIRDIAQENSAIFVGRASDYILRDMECLNVFITAPMPNRIKAVAERCCLSEEEAEKLILRKDNARKSWYNFFTLKRWGLAANYDLCIDSTLLGIDGTADFIIDFAKRRGMITSR